jgi:hypothetical protein
MKLFPIFRQTVGEIKFYEAVRPTIIFITQLKFLDKQFLLDVIKLFLAEHFSKKQHFMDQLSMNAIISPRSNLVLFCYLPEFLDQ